jgi:hypothetical protein
MICNHCFTCNLFQQRNHVTLSPLSFVHIILQFYMPNQPRKLQYFETETVVVKGKKKLVQRRVNRSSNHKGGSSSKKRAGSSPERPSSTLKAPRTLSPTPFDDSYDFMDTTVDALGLPGNDRGKPGKVRFFSHRFMPFV